MKKYIYLILIFVMAIAFVQQENEPSYATEVNTSNEQDKVIINEGIIGTNLTWKMAADGVLYLDGDGMPDFTSFNPPWIEYKDEIVEVVLSSSVDKIGAYAFFEFSNLKSINLDEVSSIGHSAFYGTSLEEVFLLNYNSNVEVYDYAFACCDSLSSISIPQNASIGEYVFSNCSSLKDAYINSGNLENTIASISDNAFNNTKVTIIYPKWLNVSESVKLKYNSEIEWLATDYGKCGYSVKWKYDEETATLTISGEGKTGRYRSGSCTPWWLISDRIDTILVEDGITYIETYLFEYLENVTFVELPQSLKTIACNAFNSCSSLQNILIPYSVESFTNYYGILGGVSDIYYEGTEEEWVQIKNAIINEKFNMHYLNYKECTATCTIDGIEAHYIFDDNSPFSYVYDIQKNRISEVKEVKALGHNYELIDTEAPDCTIEGHETYKCNRCNDLYEVVLEAAGHIYGEWIIDKKPTCTESGSKYKECHCGNRLTEDIEATGHIEEQDEAIAATCEKTGLTKGLHCSECGEVLVNQEVIEATGHNWDDDYTIDKKVTCIENGLKSIHCVNCDEVKDVTVIEKTGHDYSVWIVDKEVTCTENGSKYKKCSVCGDTVTEEIENTGHIWDDDYTIDKAATCIEKGVKSIHCANCNEVKDVTIIEKTGHDYSNWIIDKEPTCLKKGSKHKVCTVCGETVAEELDLIEHSWDENYTIDKEPTVDEDGYKSIHCANCDATKDTVLIDRITDTFNGPTDLVCIYEGKIKVDDSWSYTFNAEHMTRLYISLNDPNINEYEETYLDYTLSIKNAETGENVYYKSNYIFSDDVFEETLDLPKGTYIICLENDCEWNADVEFVVERDYIYSNYDPFYYITDNNNHDVYEFNVYRNKQYQLYPAVGPDVVGYKSVVWSSSDSTIAKVSDTGLVTGISAGTATIFVNIDGYECHCTVTVKEPKYKLDCTSVFLYQKQTKMLKVSVSPSSYGIESVKWKSSNTSVATVSSNGLVTAKEKGTATITATVNGKSINCKVTVKPMGMNYTAKTVYVKKTTTLKINGGTGTTKWSSSNNKVATVTSKGVVKGIKPGTATITAKKNGKIFKCKVYVKWPPETGIVTTKNYIVYDQGLKNLYFKGRATVKITIENCSSWDDYVYVSLGAHSWFLDENEIIVDTVTVNAGNQILDYDLLDKCKIKLEITIKPQITKTSANIADGFKRTLMVAGVKNGGTWYSSNKKIATVDSKGVVKGKKKGTCYIKYKLKTGKILKCKVAVVTPVTCRVTYVYDTSIYNECGVKFTNYTHKKIVDIDFKIKQYNNRGKRLSSPFSRYHTNDSLAAFSSYEHEAWVNNSARKCKAYITKVYFSDGSTWKP